MLKLTTSAEFAASRASFQGTSTIQQVKIIYYLCSRTTVLFSCRFCHDYNSFIITIQAFYFTDFNFVIVLLNDYNNDWIYTFYQLLYQFKSIWTSTSFSESKGMYEMKHPETGMINTNINLHQLKCPISNSTDSNHNANYKYIPTPLTFYVQWLYISFWSDAFRSIIIIIHPSKKQHNLHIVDVVIRTKQHC